MSQTYVILGELPIEAFHDSKLREFCWGQMRKSCERRIPEEGPGWHIGDPQYDHRETFFGRYAPISDNLALWPCPEAEAEVAAMRLVVRADPDEEAPSQAVGPPGPETGNQQRQTGEAG